MRKTRQQPPLDTEPAPEEINIPMVERESLEREACTKSFVLNLVHLRHAAMTKRAYYPIRAYGLAWRKCRRREIFFHVAYYTKMSKPLGDRSAYPSLIRCPRAWGLAS